MKDKNIAKHLEEAARRHGSEASLARALNVSRGAFNQWKKDGREVPAKHAPIIESLTGVKSEDLCPSVPWCVVRKGKAKTLLTLNKQEG